eukprot:TRINITY_DN2543_c0_g1_i3.p1 TRINITY_DN2543_c0_g1~~TRINITY_DN2543_c0_g1_i3.p1  ORF type:complete len:459 (-),score=-0.17 TRINITY_DN2543_c0_g1_i3:249-1625(-)
MDPRPKRSLRAPKKLSTRGRYVDDDEEEDSPVEDSSSSDSGNDSEAGDDSDDDPSWDGRRGEEDDFNVKPKKSRGGFRGRGRGRPGRPPANGHSSVHHDTYTPAQPQAYVQPAFVQQVAHQQRMMQQYGQPPSQSPSAAYLQQPGYAFPSQPPSYRSAQGSLIQPLGRAPVPPPQLVRPLGQPASPGQPTPQQQPTHIPGGYVVSSPYGPVPAQLLAKTGVSGSPAPGVRLTPGGYTTPQVSGAALPVNGQPGLAPPPSDDATNRKRNADGSPVVNGSTAGSNPPQPSSNVVASTNPFAVPVPASPNPFLSIGAPGPTQDAAVRLWSVLMGPRMPGCFRREPNLRRSLRFDVRRACLRFSIPAIAVSITEARSLRLQCSWGRSVALLRSRCRRRRVCRCPPCSDERLRRPWLAFRLAGSYSRMVIFDLAIDSNAETCESGLRIPRLRSVPSAIVLVLN